MTTSAYARPEGDTTTRAADPLAGFPGILDCVHCGFCMDVCPTYKVSGNETDSPRGRIALLRASAEGRLAAADIEEALDRCVLCRACEPACPSAVPYHSLVERHREGSANGALRFLLRRVLPSRRMLGFAGLVLRALRTVGVLGLMEHFAPRRLRAMAGAVPRSAVRFVPSTPCSFRARGARRGRVGLHLGCVNAEFFGGVLRDTIEVLTVQGFDVFLPDQPACCGALHAHSGDAAFGRALATRTLDAFPPDLDAILVPSAGCGAHLSEHDPSRGVADPLAFLSQTDLRPSWQSIPMRVAWDPPCHLQNVMGGAAAARSVLEQIPGVEIVSHSEADLCCGAGGIAFARQPGISDGVLERKLDHLEAAAPDCVASGNPGCLLRLESGLRLRQSGIEAVHPVQILARAARHAT